VAVAGLRADVAIVGGGIVGLAAAHALRRRAPDARIAVLEKEPAPGRHQSGHNSGVIHSGIYYRPGSLRARLCVEGARRMVDFCRERGIAHEVCGKLIVATSEAEVPRLEELRRRAAQNGVAGVERLDPAAMAEIEPNVRGLAALRVGATGIADYPGVVAALAAELEAGGATLACRAEVVAARREGGVWRLRTAAGDVEAAFLVTCAGLQADLVAARCGADPDVRIVPFRGEYYVLRQERADLVRGLVYPVPDPALPFLGVHFTRTVSGLREAGPNAVLAFAREGYARTAFHAAELAATLAYPGFRALLRRHWRTALGEYHRSWSKGAFVAALRRLVPALRAEDLAPGGAGVRAQAVDRAGRLLDDFHLLRAEGALHVLNAPSPAATASLAIGEHVAALVLG
jgi:L-2-hydroxyglutarate oxidase